MNTMATGTVMVVLTAAQCGGGAEKGGSRPCDPVVVSDAVEAVARGDEVVVTAKASGDTVPRPYKVCVSLYAQAKDTVPKP